MLHGQCSIILIESQSCMIFSWNLSKCYRIVTDFFNFLIQWKETSLEINDWKLKCVLEIPEAVEGAATSTPAATVNSTGTCSTYSTKSIQLISINFNLLIEWC